MPEKNKIDWVGFGFNLSSSMFFLINGIVFIGSLSLYTSLIAQTDLLDLNISTQNNGENKTANAIAHITRIYSGFPPHLDKEIKTELTLEQKSINAMLDNKLINGLKKSNITLVHFIKEVLFSMISNNYMVINTVYGMLYKIPESIALCLSLFITPLLWLIMFFINISMAGIYHIVHFKEYFASCSGEGNCGGYSFTPIHFMISFSYALFFALPMILFVYPIIAIFYSYLSPLLVVFSNKKTGKKYNFLEYAIDMISYKRQLIMWLISLTVVRVVYMNLGIYDAISCLVSIIILAAFTRIYSQYVPDCGKKTV